MLPRGPGTRFGNMDRECGSLPTAAAAAVGGGIQSFNRPPLKGTYIVTIGKVPYRKIRIVLQIIELEIKF